MGDGPLCEIPYGPKNIPNGLKAHLSDNPLSQKELPITPKAHCSKIHNLPAVVGLMTASPVCGSELVVVLPLIGDHSNLKLNDISCRFTINFCNTRCAEDMAW